MVDSWKSNKLKTQNQSIAHSPGLDSMRIYNELGKMPYKNSVDGIIYEMDQSKEESEADQ